MNVLGLPPIELFPPPPPFSEFDPAVLLRTPISRPSTAPPRLAEAPATRASFAVAGRDLTTPLVTVAGVKAHLKLLSAFHQLRQDVIAYKQPELEAAGITDDDRWSIFLVKAHHRFEVWFTSRTCEPEACKLPGNSELHHVLTFTSTQMIIL